MLMKKKIIIISIILVVIIFIIWSYSFYQNWKIKNAVIKVDLIDNLELDVYSNVKLNDLIKNINGKIEKNFKINTKKLGKKKISFNYINEDNIKVGYSFYVQIIDKTAPIISRFDTYTIPIGYLNNLEEELFCGDNYDDKPLCKIEGYYNKNQVGNYNVTFKAVDSSGNKSENNFTIKVEEKRNSSNTNSKPTTTSFKDIITNYKNKDTNIGIDISHWQGDIDFEKVKNSSVEFVFIRVGSQKGINSEYIIDDKFVQNIKGFNSVGIPVGVYFYSYANSKKEAIKQAKWIIKQVKNYNISLPIALDWENWSTYQDFHLSFYHLSEIANSFLKTIEDNGYIGMLYSSKNYLENIWSNINYPIWLAHYTNKTDYLGKYKVWQLCNNGIVDGINDNLVDIDIMY